MSNHKIVYLIVEKGANGHTQTFWRVAGTAYECRDGSFNMRLDIHPTLIFNIRNPKSNGELNDAVRGEVPQMVPDSPLTEHTGKNGTASKQQDPIPF